MSHHTSHTPYLGHISSLKADITTLKGQNAGTIKQDGLFIEHQDGNSVNYINSTGDDMAYLGLFGKTGTNAIQSIVYLGADSGNGVELSYTHSGTIFRIKRVSSGTATEVLSFTKSSNNVAFSGAITDSNGTTITSAEKAKLAYITISNDANLSTMETATTTNATNIALKTTKGLNRCLEKISAICDGRKMYPDYLKSAGTKYLTTTDVDAVQAGTAGAWVDIVGSSIAYTPPTLGEYDSATRGSVIYKFSFCLGRTADGEGMASFQLLIDGTEVEAKASQVIGNGSFYGTHVHFECPIEIDSGLSDSAANAVFASWTSAKTLKLQMWEYASGTEIRLFQPYYWESGYVSNATMPILQPTISVETYGYG